MNNLYYIDLHPDVESDYDSAYYWYECEQIGLGERFLLAVHEKIDFIRLSPELYDFKSKRVYREAKVKGFPYLIVYRLYPRKKRIFISAIHHTSLHPNKKYRKQ